MEYELTSSVSNSDLMGIFIAFLIPLLIFSAVMIVAQWKIFEKAGKPGWAAIVPFYNFIVMLQVAKMSLAYLLLLFLPVIGPVIIGFMMSIRTARGFGRSAIFGIFGLMIFSFIGYPILAFGSDQYNEYLI